MIVKSALVVGLYLLLNSTAAAGQGAPVPSNGLEAPAQTTIGEPVIQKIYIDVPETPVSQPLKEKPKHIYQHVTQIRKYHPRISYGVRWTWKRVQEVVTIFVGIAQAKQTFQ